ncbi:MAG: hypothetical protein K0S71_2327 [Clostridia bacterium]|jgi:uncharacterized protein YvpB|nr:hypothetical protein [Clostridia bacterium]
MRELKYQIKKSITLLFLMALLSIDIGFTGCQNDKNPNPAQSQNMSAQNPKAKKENFKKTKQKSKKEVKKKVLIDVPIISQMPELQNGCEITSLAMLLQHAGIKVDKMALAQEIKKDKTPLLHDEEGNMKQWGNPSDGFVGDITGKNDGFGVYPKPMIELMETYIPGRSVDLTKQPFETLLESIDQGNPVIVWVTARFKAPKEYREWEKNGNKIKATFDEHAVLLVGYDKKYCYINNPFNGKKNQKVKKDTFMKIWGIMGNMAVSYR